MTESNHARIPAGVFWFKSMLDNRKWVISDDLPSGHWIKTYCSKTFVQVKAPLPDFKVMKDLPGAKDSLKKYLLKAPNGVGPKMLSGKSLYEAASALKGKADPSLSKGEAKGLERALRYYMLATYSLIDMLAVQKKGTSQVNNYVAAILVSDEGQILSAGVNVGSFMHAEVSMLLSYFINNPDRDKLPPRSLVFSTLTPCMQCTKFLMESRSSSTLMYFGQMDKGDFGNIGALDVAGFKKTVADDKTKDYDVSYITGMPGEELMALPAIFGKEPKVYNINQGEINDVVKLISDLKSNKATSKSAAYNKLTGIDFSVKGKISNTAGQLKSKEEAVKVFSASTTTLAAKAKISEQKAKNVAGDDAAFRGIQSSVLEYLTRSLVEIQFYT